MRSAVFSALILQLWGWWPWGDQHEACAPQLGDDVYTVLGVSRSADKVTVNKAYRALAKVWHPDRFQHQQGAADRATQAFAAVAHAYSVISDPEKREVFDRLGAPGLQRLQDGDPRVKKGWIPPAEVKASSRTPTTTTTARHRC
jgi:DnaJ-class molecular chaperone